MTKARTNSVAEAAADAFNRTVDELVMGKLLEGVNLKATGVTAASMDAVNTVTGKPGPERTR